MEQLRARAALDRGQVNRWRSALSYCGTALWLVPTIAWGHSGEFILAKCSTGADGRVSVVLTVDCGQHPVLKDRSAAQAAMRQALQVETDRGPVSLDALAEAAPSFSAIPDPDLPLSADPVGGGLPHVLALLAYSWRPGGPEVSFSVPSGFPHDVLFWLGDGARPATGPVPWRILMAGDLTPGIPVPVIGKHPRPSPMAGGALAAGTGSVLWAGFWWRRYRRQVRES